MHPIVKMSPLIVVYLYGFVIVAAMSDVTVELRAPRFVVHHHSAVLRCEHNVDPSLLDKVVFFQHGQRIMKYVRERDPQFETFNITGAEIDLMTLTPTSITLERLDFSATGQYFCEIGVEVPLYSKVSKVHELNIIVRQKYRPKIKIKHKKLSSNDYLEATCHSGPAHPAPHLSWFINNMKVLLYMPPCYKSCENRVLDYIQIGLLVDESLTIPHGTVNVHRHHHGMPLSITNSSLHFPLSSLQPFPNKTVVITCLSTIPSYAIGEGYADVQNSSVHVNVVRIDPVPTQLPVKIMSSEHNLSAHCEIELVLIAMLLFVCQLSF